MKRSKNFQETIKIKKGRRMKMRKTIKETILLVFTAAVVGKVVAPFIMLANCGILAKPEIYNLFTYIR